MPLPQKKEHYTYADYRTWDDSERCELIDGVVYAMSPAPLRRHQRILGNLHLLFAAYLKDQPCEVYLAPFDVRLNASTVDDTVVQPDLVIVCDSSKLDDYGCCGAPDLVAEVLSPSTVRLDQVVKFNAYQQAGVREYWIVDPDTLTVSVYVLENGRYYALRYSDDDTADAQVLPGCRISLTDVFADQSYPK